MEMIRTTFALAIALSASLTQLHAHRRRTFGRAGIAVPVSGAAMSVRARRYGRPPARPIPRRSRITALYLAATSHFSSVREARL